MKLEEQKTININLLRTVDAAKIDPKNDWLKDWLKSFILFIQDQFLNRKWAYKITIIALSTFPVGRMIVALINTLLEEAAKEQI